MKKLFFLFLMLLIVFFIYRPSGPILSLFPLNHYDQALDHWLSPSDPNYDQALLSPDIQQKHLAGFYKHYVGRSSPWSEHYVTRVLKEAHFDLSLSERSVIKSFSSRTPRSQGYGENFRPYAPNWILTLTAKINFTKLEHLQFNPRNRGISIRNLAIRALPTDDPFFYHHTIAGEGYPFDNLQSSALFAGSPVYVLLETEDKMWSLVLTADVIGWVHSDGVASVSDSFVKTWQQMAKYHLAAIIKTETSMIDTQGQYRFTTYVGAVFPVNPKGELLIPVSDEKQKATIHYVKRDPNTAALMPIAATPHQFSNIMRTLLGRPYGWGNSYFYNDCSAELKSLFTPFGIWLPRHSSDQVDAGKKIDLSAESPKDRIANLIEQGHPFFTVVYINGHVFLYLGTYHNPQSPHETVALTFQNMWGLQPKSGERRAVIGQSVLFPLLLSYPEDRELASQASKPYFWLGQLDVTPNHLAQTQELDLKQLMAF